MNSKDLPVFQCHKQVRAFKINNFRREDLMDSCTVLSHMEKHRATVPMALIRKHLPKAGWYYVQYEDGYESFSPPEAFEKGYTLVDIEQGFPWADFESKPTTRRAFQITSAHELDWFEDSKTLTLTDGENMIKAACHQEPKPGDFIVYLNEKDIYHCSEEVFRERNVVSD